jgi:hypothetical protein
MTDQEELDLINTRLRAMYTDGVQEYGESSERARMIEFRQLTERKKELVAALGRANGGTLFQGVQRRL